MMSKVRSHPWVIWSVVVLFYFYQYFIRICPSVFIEDLIHDFHLDATGVGNLSAFYFYIYAILQIPVGILLDKLGSKWLLSSAAFVCALGTLLFGLSSSFILADLGRLLQGAGSAFAFIGMIYVSAHYFPASYLGLLICLGDSLGKLGAVVGSGPFSNLLNHMHWKNALILIGVVGVFLAFIIYFFIKEPRQECALPVSLKEQIKTLVLEKQMWLTVLVSSLLVVVTTSFAGLWGAPFLHTAYNMSKEMATYAISMFFLGAIIGAPLTGYISDLLQKRAPFLLFSGVVSSLCIYLLIYRTSMHFPAVYSLLFILGMLASIQNLTYCIAIEQNPPSFKGAATGYVNLFVFLTGAMTQPLMGFLIEKHSTMIFKSSYVYNLQDYQYAFRFLPIAFLLAAFFSLFLKDKKKT